MATVTSKKKSVEEKLPVDANKVKAGHLMAFIYYGHIEKVDRRQEILYVKDANIGQAFRVQGDPIVERSLSADQYNSTKRITKTRLAEVLVAAHNRPFSVCWVKQDGKERVLRGRLLQSSESILGRSKVEDLDLPVGEHRVRLVDHRTIKWLIVDGVKYTVRK